jgi:hypothetical protein
MNYDEENDEKYLEQLQQSVGVLEKVLESLVFKGVEVKHDFHVVPNDFRSYAMLQFYIDIDKQYKGSPTYDEEYKNVVHEIEHKVEDVLRYAGLSPHGGVGATKQHYTYINDDYVKEVTKNCHDELMNILTNEYNIPYNLIQEYLIMIQLNDNPDYPTDTTILAYSYPLTQGFGTDSRLMDNGIDCDKLSEIVDGIFERNGVTESGFRYQNSICEKNMR